MIKETKGNLLATNAEALVNAVNCFGVMGKGIALQFRRKFSEEYFKDYKPACESGDLAIGKAHVYLLSSKAAPRFIVNFPTKNHWREKSRVEDIESGLQSLAEAIRDYNIKSIAMPALGCGLGGLDWKVVRPLIETVFVNFNDVEILLFLPPNLQT